MSFPIKNTGIIANIMNNNKENNEIKNELDELNYFGANKRSLKDISAALDKKFYELALANKISLT